MADAPKPTSTTAQQQATAIRNYSSAGVTLINTATAVTTSTCPAPSWKDLVQVTREVPIFLFAPACLPGSATEAGCPVEQSFFTIAVPWELFIRKEPIGRGTSTDPWVHSDGSRSWQAPGGNRYWAREIPANLRDPRVTTILNMMVAMSKKRFQNEFKSSPKTLIKDILAKGEYVTKFGNVSLKRPPTPDETIDSFIRRDGFLLWKKAFTGPGTYFDFYNHRPKWWPGDVVAAQLWANYVPEQNAVGYSIRLVYKGDWQKLEDTVVGAVKDAINKVCSSLQSKEGQEAAAAAAAATLAFPALAPYMAGYGAVLAACSLDLDPPCLPRPPAPGEALPVIPNSGTNDAVIRTPKQGTAAYQANIQNMVSTMSLAPARPIIPQPGTLPPETPTPPTYPIGSIAWFDPTLKRYYVATPEPGKDTTHVLTQPPLATLPPIGIRVVDKKEWEKATLPLLKRGTTKTAGLVVGGGLTALGLLVAFLHQRHA